MQGMRSALPSTGTDTGTSIKQPSKTAIALQYKTPPASPSKKRIMRDRDLPPSYHHTTTTTTTTVANATRSVPTTPTKRYRFSKSILVNVAHSSHGTPIKVRSAHLFQSGDIDMTPSTHTPSSSSFDYSHVHRSHHHHHHRPCARMFSFDDTDTSDMADDLGDDQRRADRTQEGISALSASSYETELESAMNLLNLSSEHVNHNINTGAINATAEESYFK